MEAQHESIWITREWRSSTRSMVDVQSEPPRASPWSHAGSYYSHRFSPWRNEGSALLRLPLEQWRLTLELWIGFLPTKTFMLTKEPWRLTVKKDGPKVSLLSTRASLRSSRMSPWGTMGYCMFLLKQDVYPSLQPYNCLHNINIKRKNFNILTILFHDQ